MFFIAPTTDPIAHLDEEETLHCTRTLRHQLGDVLDLMDGAGFWYKGELVSIQKKTAAVKILDRQAAPARRAQSLHLGIAPTKNIERIEFLLEKAVEIGVERFSLLQCQHSERKQVRLDRLEKIAKAAAKQSLQAHFTELTDIQPFETFLKQNNHITARKFIAYCGEAEGKIYLPQALAQASPLTEHIVLIGAEGDFSPLEVALAQSYGYTPVSLGSSRLRTETAGLAAVLMLAQYAEMA